MRGSGILGARRIVLVIGRYVAGGRVVSYYRILGYVRVLLLIHLGDDTDAEACQIVFDPEKVSYRTLIEYFYKMHDPTTANRQGPDTGSQYRSGIFYHDDEQKKVAEEVTKKVNEQWWKGGVVTEILQAGQWWDAEKYHQLYLQSNPGGYECPSQ